MFGSALPVEHRQPLRTHPIEQRLLQLFVRRFGQWLGAQRQTADLLALPGAQRALLVIPLHRRALRDDRRQLRRQRVDVHRQRQQDARIGAVVALQQAGDDEPGRARQRLVLIHRRPHAVGQQVAAVLASPLGDAIGKRQRQQPRRQIDVDLPCTLRQAFGQLRGTLPPVRLRAAQPVADIHLPAARRFFQQCRQQRRRSQAVGT